MSKTIHFNTGRQYTVHGQRITATLHDELRMFALAVTRPRRRLAPVVEGRRGRA